MKIKLFIYIMFFYLTACGSSQPATPEATAAVASPEDLQRKAVLSKVEELLTQDQVYAEAGLKAIIRESKSPFNPDSFTDTVAQSKKANEKLLEFTAQIKSLNPSIKDELRDQLLDFFEYENKFNNLLSTIDIVSTGLDEIMKFNKTMQKQEFKDGLMSGVITFSQVITKLKSYNEPLQYTIDTVDTLGKALDILSKKEVALLESFKKRGLTSTPNVFTLNKENALKQLSEVSKLISNIKEGQTALVKNLESGPQ